jgi:hypothetical protein
VVSSKATLGIQIGTLGKQHPENLRITSYCMGVHFSNSIVVFWAFVFPHAHPRNVTYWFIYLEAQLKVHLLDVAFFQIILSCIAYHIAID